MGLRVEEGVRGERADGLLERVLRRGFLAGWGR